MSRRNTHTSTLSIWPRAASSSGRAHVLESSTDRQGQTATTRVRSGLRPSSASWSEGTVPEPHRLNTGCQRLTQPARVRVDWRRGGRAIGGGAVAPLASAHWLAAFPRCRLVLGLGSNYFVLVAVSAIPPCSTVGTRGCMHRDPAVSRLSLCRIGVVHRKATVLRGSRASGRKQHGASGPTP